MGGLDVVELSYEWGVPHPPAGLVRLLTELPNLAQGNLPLIWIAKAHEEAVVWQSLEDDSSCPCADSCVHRDDSSGREMGCKCVRHEHRFLSLLEASLPKVITRLHDEVTNVKYFPRNFLEPILSGYFFPEISGFSSSAIFSPKFSDCHPLTSAMIYGTASQKVRRLNYGTGFHNSMRLKVKGD